MLSKILMSGIDYIVHEVSSTDQSTITRWMGASCGCMVDMKLIHDAALNV